MPDDDPMEAAMAGALAPSSGDSSDPMRDAMSNALAPPAAPVAAPVVLRAQHAASTPRASTTGAARAAPAKSAPAVDPSWGQVGSQALQNLVPSFAGQVKGIVAPLLPQNWGNDITTAVQLAKGVGAHAGLIDQNNPAQKQKDTTQVDALANYYARKYGSVSGFKQAMANDPASFLTDIASVASIPAGGEGLAAKVPGVLGDAAQAITRGAGAVARATNPIGLSARAIGAALPRATAAAAPVTRAIAKAFPSGVLTVADMMADPAAQTALQTVAGQKGISPASVREALLRRFDAPTGQPTPVPTSVVTGTAPPQSAVQAVGAAVTQWKQHVANAVQAISGAPEPSPSALGDALQEAQTAAQNAYTQKYAAVGQHAGVFDPSFNEGVTPTIETQLSNEGVVSNLGELDRRPSLEQTRNSIAFLNDYLGAYADELTPQRLMGARKELGQFRMKADGTDQHGVGAVIDAFDNHIQSAAQNGLYQAPPGTPDGAQVANDLAGAVASYKGFKQIFANPAPGYNVVRSAVKNFSNQPTDPITGLITGPADTGSSAAAQGALIGKLINPKTLAVPAGAEKLYGTLSGIMGGPGSDGAQALNDYIRQTVTRTAPDGSLVAKPDQIHQFLSSPLADAFTPAEQSTLKQAAEAQRLLTTAPSRAAQGESFVKSMTGRLVRPAIAGTLGHLVGGPLGEGVGILAEQALEGSMASRGAAKALQGAPAVGGWLYGPGRAAAAMAAKPVTPLLTEFYGAQPMSQTAQGNADAANATAGPSAGGAPIPGTNANMANMSYAQKVGHWEAGGNPTIPNQMGGNALGLGQFEPKTWLNMVRKYRPDVAAGKSDAQLLALRTDPDLSNEMIDDYGNDNAEKFGDNIPVNDATKYGAHWFGVGGFKKVFGAPDDASIGSVLNLSQADIARNKFQGKTVGDIKSIIERRMGVPMSGSWTGGRIERASGGRAHDVEHECLVQRLMSLAVKAKKASNEVTKPLLHVSDNTVAKALAVAQAAI